MRCSEWYLLHPSKPGQIRIPRPGECISDTEYYLNFINIGGIILLLIVPIFIAWIIERKQLSAKQEWLQKIIWSAITFFSIVVGLYIINQVAWVIR